MVQIHPNIRKQLKELEKAVSHDIAKRSSAMIVELPIGQLSPKMTDRALYMLTNAFTNLTKNQQVMAKTIKSSIERLEEIIDNKDLTRDQMVKLIKSDVLDPSDDAIRSSEHDSSGDKESSPPS